MKSETYHRIGTGHWYRSEANKGYERAFREFGIPTKGLVFMGKDHRQRNIRSMLRSERTGK